MTPAEDTDGHARIVEDLPRPLDPDDEQSPEVAVFHWLDRPKVEARSGLSREQIPLVQADLLVGSDTVMMEAFDDGRLNDLIDQFTALAGRAVPPAHPRTKVIGTAQSRRTRDELALVSPSRSARRGKAAAQSRTGRLLDERGLAEDAAAVPGQPDTLAACPVRQAQDTPPRC